MSDIFDHEADAWDSLNDYGVEEDGSELHPTNFSPDPNYYHIKMPVLAYVAETEKSWLIEFTKDKKYWIPKKICRDKKSNSILIHTVTLNKIISESKGN